MTLGPLRDRRILVVEDEYLLATDLERDLASAGAVVLGPVPSVERALALIDEAPNIDAAVVDVNLAGTMSYPVADALIARGIPFVFTTGYVDGNLDNRYPQIIRCDKPLAFRRLELALAAVLQPAASRR